MAKKKNRHGDVPFFLRLFLFFCGSGVSREADINTALFLFAIASMQFACTTGFAADAAPTKPLLYW